MGGVGGQLNVQNSSVPEILPQPRERLACPGCWLLATGCFLAQARAGWLLSVVRMSVEVYTSVHEASTPDVLSGGPALGLDYTVLCYG